MIVVIGGLLVVVPIYLAVLVLLNGMKSVRTLVRPFVQLLPDWLPAEQALSLLLVLFVCFLIGVAVRARAGRAIRARIESGFLEKIPGYALFRSLTQQVAGDERQNVWKPALVEFPGGDRALETLSRRWKARTALRGDVGVDPVEFNLSEQPRPHGLRIGGQAEVLGLHGRPSRD